MNSFLHYLEFEKRYSQHTIAAYKKDLDQFWQYLFDLYGIQKKKEIKDIHIRSWLAQLMDDGVASKSVNRKLSTLKSYFKFLIRNSEITNNPSIQIQGPKSKKRLPVFVEEVKMDTLFNIEIDEGDFESFRDHLILELFYTTGMRRAELIGLNNSHLYFSQNLIKVIGKRNKERLLPVSKLLMSKIQSYILLRDAELEEIIDESILFLTKRGKKLYPKLVYRIVNSYLSKVSTQDKKSPHVLRHTFATHMLNNGADLNAVKELLGHSSLAATQIYTHNTIEKLKEVYNQAHPKA
jgi:integrase/recombinase XerC